MSGAAGITTVFIPLVIRKRNGRPRIGNRPIATAVFGL